MKFATAIAVLAVSMLGTARANHGKKMSMMGGKKSGMSMMTECPEPPTSTPIPTCDEGVTVLDTESFCGGSAEGVENTLFVLNEDIECTSQSEIEQIQGFFLNGNGNVLDCRGNTISYSGTATGDAVALLIGGNNHVIKNCVIGPNFATGIFASDFDNSWDNLLVQDTTVTGAALEGLIARGPGTLTVISSAFNANGRGILIQTNVAATILDSETNSNVAAGLQVSSGSSMTVIGHSASDNGTGATSSGAAFKATASTFCDNTIDIVDGSQTADLTAVTCDDNGDPNFDCDCSCPTDTM